MSNMEFEENKRPGGTRVFKKSSPNGKITVYLGRRDFCDSDPVDGVVLIDPDINKNVYGHVLAAFKFGREDLDLLGLSLRKDLYLATEKIYPDSSDVSGNGRTELKRPLTKLQERLIRKLGPDARPFYFELPLHCPASVTLQPSPGDSAKPCGVEYELKFYAKNGDNSCAESRSDDKAHKRNSVRLAIRKIMYAPSTTIGEQPSIEVSKEFIGSRNKLHLEVSLDKQLYYHGDSISVYVHISNNSNRTVKKIRVSVRQFADICLFSSSQYKCTVAEVESDDGCPVGPGFTLSKVLCLKPLLENNLDKRGLALDGQLRHGDTNLASSTILPSDQNQKENLGIIVQYRVKVKLCLGSFGGDLVAELPFILMHPKPAEDPPVARNASTSTSTNVENVESSAMETDLIKLDTDVPLEADDDLIFEDFARLRLRGETEA